MKYCTVQWIRARGHLRKDVRIHMFCANRGSGTIHGLSCAKRGSAAIHSLRKTIHGLHLVAPWSASRTFARSVRVQQKFCLDFVCLWTLRTLSWLNGVDYTLSLSLSLSLSRPIGYGGPLTVGWQLTKDVSLISTGRQATAPNSLTGPLSWVVF